ncbi:hypothetical protein [Primorskyibacter sp. S187A]|uniref:hypothetical protein n=1 Tax=Primorskyibacter sp. S187A TaxID=3415130 RepID=UPI003C7D0A2D
MPKQTFKQLAANDCEEPQPVNLDFSLRALAARKPLHVRGFRRCKAAVIAAIGSWRCKVFGGNFRVADEVVVSRTSLDGRIHGCHHTEMRDCLSPSRKNVDVVASILVPNHRDELYPPILPKGKDLPASCSQIER